MVSDHKNCHKFYCVALFMSEGMTCFTGTIMTISKDRVKPSPVPDSWKLSEIFTTGIVLGAYMALMTVIFFWLAYETNFFEVIGTTSHLSILQFGSAFWVFIFDSPFPQNTFGVKDFNSNHFDMQNEDVAKKLKEHLASAVYLQVSTISQALIFVTRSRGFSFTERPGLLLVTAFIIAQLV